MRFFRALVNSSWSSSISIVVGFYSHTKYPHICSTFLFTLSHAELATTLFRHFHKTTKQTTHELHNI